MADGSAIEWTDRHPLTGYPKRHYPEQPPEGLSGLKLAEWQRDRWQQNTWDLAEALAAVGLERDRLAARLALAEPERRFWRGMCGFLLAVSLAVIINENWRDLVAFFEGLL